MRGCRVMLAAPRVKPLGAVTAVVPASSSSTTTVAARRSPPVARVAAEVPAFTKTEKAWGPVALDRKSIPAKILETEKEVFREEVKNKPANIQEKILEGKLGKFYQEKCLVEQVFVKDPEGKQTVQQMLKAANTSVKTFTMFVVGEGIEKKQDDFAAEVAAQVAAAKQG